MSPTAQVKLIGATIMLVIILLFFATCSWILTPSKSKATNVTETYRLVHAIGNEETIVASGLDKYDCESQKAERKKIATALGTYNEATGFGSITCLPESDF